MLMKKFFLFAAMALIPALASAQSVYAYKDGSGQAVAKASNVHRIEFTDAGINLVGDSAKATNIALADVDYLLFYEKAPVTTAIGAIGTSAAGIAFDGQSIAVNSAEPISSVTILSTDGTEFASFKPETNSVAVPATSLPTGVYIVKAVAGGKTTVSKILVK